MHPKHILPAACLLLTLWGWLQLLSAQDPVPKDNTTQAELKPMRLEHMARGYFHASSSGGSDMLAGFGGWGGSGNASMKFSPQSGRTGLEILVDTMVLVPFAKEFEGRSVSVRNHGPDTLFFPAQDSRLYMKAQAMDKGSFADIEYLPSSWCGNSYHTLYLAPYEEWRFAMPNYDGKQQVRLRLELIYKTDPSEEEQIVAFSHTFPGAIHPKQFREKLEYRSGGIMDPYDD